MCMRNIGQKKNPWVYASKFLNMCMYVWLCVDMYT